MELNDRTMQLIRYLLILGGPIASNWLEKHFHRTLSPEEIDAFATQFIIYLPDLMSFMTMAWGFFVKKGTVAVPTDVVRKSEENPSIPTIPTVNSATGQITVAPEVPRDYVGPL